MIRNTLSVHQSIEEIKMFAYAVPFQYVAMPYTSVTSVHGLHYGHI